ncbi:MAG TPA: CBS domain-containing protein [Bryobacteraceae bacterium]|nr:CBS domain-containing protein [Bryobacteraceae bacterium]
MTKDPTCCSPGDPVLRAAEIMKQDDIGSVPVVENHEGRKLIGIVTDRDLVLNIMAENKDLASSKVQEAMTLYPVTCHEGDNLDHAMDLMATHQVRRIPVVDAKGCILGIISQADLATRVDKPKKTAEVLEEISQPVVQHE